MKAVFAKGRGNVLIPADPEAEKLLKRIALGDGISVEAKKFNDIRFHRKLFALLNLAFDIWEPDDMPEVRGQKVAKNFDRFRKDVTILAGHYTVLHRLDGSVYLEADSLSFAKCDDHKKNDVYRSILNVVWERVLKHANFRDEQEVEQVVNQLIAFE